MPTPAVLLAGLLFGSIGLLAAIIGRRSERWRMMGIGIALMVFPYFVSDIGPLVGIGLALCLGLYFWRD